LIDRLLLIVFLLLHRNRTSEKPRARNTSASRDRRHSDRELQAGLSSGQINWTRSREGRGAKGHARGYTAGERGNLDDCGAHVRLLPQKAPTFSRRANAIHYRIHVEYRTRPDRTPAV